MAAIYKQRDSLKLDPESLRLVEFYYKKFVHSGANLSDSDKAELKKLNEEESTLTNAFTTKLLAATKDAAYVTTDKDALAGLSDAQITAAALAAKERKLEGYVVPLQNTTQQPDLDSLSHRATPADALRELLESRRTRRTRTIPATPSPAWPSCARRRPNCSAFPTTPPGSWTTRWPKRRTPR